MTMSPMDKNPPEPIYFHGCKLEWDDPEDRWDLVITDKGPFLVKRERVKADEDAPEEADK